jgi:acyl-CoA thioesterase
MDKGLAYIPALNNGYHPSEASVCASLDVSLRFFEHEFNLEEWHYTKQSSFVANHARVYSEGRVWDSNGRLLASMTQQTILLPNSKTESRL